MRRTKPHPKKDRIIADLTDRLGRAKVAIATDYRGLTVAQFSQLRRQLDPLDVDFHVAKNTLLQLAARQAGYPDMSELLTGPTAIAFGYGEETAVAKTLNDYARAVKILRIKGGALGHRLMQADEVTKLASLPPKGQLHSQVLGALQGPAARMMGVLDAPARGLLYLLQRRAEQLAGQAGT